MINPNFKHTGSYSDAEEQDNEVVPARVRINMADYDRRQKERLIRRMAGSWTLRSGARKAVQSEPVRVGNLVGNVLLYAVFLAFAAVVAWAFVH